MTIAVIIAIVLVCIFPMLFLVYIPLGIIALVGYFLMAIPSKAPVQVEPTKTPKAICEEAGWVWYAEADSTGKHCRK